VKKIAAAASTLLLSACSGKTAGTPTPAATGGAAVAGATKTPSGANAPPSVSSVAITPAQSGDHPTVTDSLHGEAVAHDPDGDGVLLDWQWYVNGAPVGGAITDHLDPGRFKKKDKVEVEVTPRDTRGAAGSAARASIEIRNSPPVLGATQFGSTTAQVVASDPDGDKLVYSIEPPLPGFEISQSGALTMTAQGKPSGQQVVIVVKDDEGASARVGFDANAPATPPPTPTPTPTPVEAESPPPMTP
jgi:hypothetical protein